MTMHTYQVDNYGIFISISQLKQATYDDLKTLEENGKVMIFDRDDIEDIEIYPLTDIGVVLIGIHHRTKTLTLLYLLQTIDPAYILQHM